MSNGKSFFATWVQAVGAARNVYGTRFDIAKGSWDALPTVVSDGESIAGYAASLGIAANGVGRVLFSGGGRSAHTIGPLLGGQREIFR